MGMPDTHQSMEWRPSVSKAQRFSDVSARASTATVLASRSSSTRRRFRSASAEAEFEEVHISQGERSGATMVIVVHRTVEGRSLGGCRMWHYGHPSDALSDAKRLARSMSFKAAAADLALGGAKAVIALPDGERPVGAQRERLLRDFAELIESVQGRYITGQDVGVSVADISYLARFTEHVAGHPVSEGGSGDPSPYTARGVEAGIRASLTLMVVVIGALPAGAAQIGHSLVACRLLLLHCRMRPAERPGLRTLLLRLGARGYPRRLNCGQPTGGLGHMV